jgi:hypothetical protein
LEDARECTSTSAAKRSEVGLARRATGTPDSFLVWLRRYTPDAKVASIYDPVHSMLAEYFWATLEVFTMYGDSIVWDDGVIEWNDLPAWVRSLNRAEARRAGTAPDDKHTWSASEVLEMADEATASGR